MIWPQQLYHCGIFMIQPFISLSAPIFEDPIDGAIIAATEADTLAGAVIKVLTAIDKDGDALVYTVVSQVMHAFHLQYIYVDRLAISQFHQSHVESLLTSYVVCTLGCEPMSRVFDSPSHNNNINTPYDYGISLAQNVDASDYILFISWHIQLMFTHVTYDYQMYQLDHEIAHDHYQGQRYHNTLVQNFFIS